MRSDSAGTISFSPLRPIDRNVDLRPSAEIITDKSINLSIVIIKGVLFSNLYPFSSLSFAEIGRDWAASEKATDYCLWQKEKTLAGRMNSPLRAHKERQSSSMSTMRAS
jgi:hypothetical protein